MPDLSTVTFADPHCAWRRRVRPSLKYRGGPAWRRCGARSGDLMRSCVDQPSSKPGGCGSLASAIGGRAGTTGAGISGGPRLCPLAFFSRSRREHQICASAWARVRQAPTRTDCFGARAQHWFHSGPVAKPVASQARDCPQAPADHAGTGNRRRRHLEGPAPRPVFAGHRRRHESPAGVQSISIRRPPPTARS